MTVDEVLESYVLDVARNLPRSKRNDVAFELRALLADELAAKAQAAGRPADREMVMELLRGFGRPEEAAARYHTRPALIEPVDTPRFLIAALAGAVTLSVLSQSNPDPPLDTGGLFLGWLGVLVIFFGLVGWWRRKNPNSMEWQPKRGPEWMPRGLAVLALAATLFFPVFMYAAPQTFVRVAFWGFIANGGLELTPEFRESWQRGATLVVLFGLAAMYAAIAVEGRQRPWTTWASFAAHGLLGLLLIAHGAPMTTPSGEAFSVFVSPDANEIAKPIFSLVGAFLVLCALYELYVEWTRVAPAPALNGLGKRNPTSS